MQSISNGHILVAFPTVHLSKIKRQTKVRKPFSAVAQQAKSNGLVQTGTSNAWYKLNSDCQLRFWRFPHLLSKGQVAFATCHKRGAIRASQARNVKLTHALWMIWAKDVSESTFSTYYAGLSAARGQGSTANSPHMFTYCCQ